MVMEKQGFNQVPAMEGCAWRVGDGRNVRVWEDKRLPSSHLPEPVSLKPESCDVSDVADLRNPEGGGWDKRKLEELFNEEEIDLISKVPLSAVGAKDRMVRKLERNGQYKVSSGYDFAMQIKRLKNGCVESSSSEAEGKRLRSKLWGLKVKRKILHFLWRCINNSLPVMNNVYKRGMKCCPFCKQFGEKLETVEHVMFECKIAKSS